MTSSELLALNGITDPRKLQVGQVLKLSASAPAGNVDAITETPAPPAPSVITTMQASPTPILTAPDATASTNTGTGPVEIKVIESDPLVEGEVSEIESDEMFEGAVEIPVIRLDAE
jgi:LysM repeat protein